MNTIFTDAEIEAAALRQRTSIEEELLKLRMRERFAAALELLPSERLARVNDFPGDAAVVFKPESSSASPPNTGSAAPQQAAPTRVSINTAAGRIASISEHNAFPRGRWS